MRPLDLDLRKRVRIGSDRIAAEPAPSVGALAASDPSPPHEGEGKPRRKAHVRAASRERQAATLLGTRRRCRSRYERAPDVEPVTLPCGVVLQAEVKTRARLPALVTKALAQASGYAPAGAVPAAVLSATGDEPIIALPLRAFRVIAGLEVPAADPQVAIAFPDLGADERRVLEAIAHRLRMGARTYGVLDVASDGRDWQREAAEELLDGCVYLACKSLRRPT